MPMPNSNIPLLQSCMGINPNELYMLPMSIPRSFKSCPEYMLLMTQMYETSRRKRIFEKAYKDVILDNTRTYVFRARPEFPVFKEYHQYLSLRDKLRLSTRYGFQANNNNNVHFKPLYLSNMYGVNFV